MCIRDRVKGIILILVFYGLAVMLNLKTVTWVLNNVITIGFMAAVVIFQPELRRTCLLYTSRCV